MVDVLVREVFRHENGLLAEFTNVKITARNDLTVLHDLVTDDYGTVSIYLPPGEYDWLVLGARTPFDVTSAVAPSDDEFVYNRPTPAASWPIAHGLGTKPDVRLFVDPDRTERVITDVIYTDLDNLVVDWPSPESGVAYLK